MNNLENNLNNNKFDSKYYQDNIGNMIEDLTKLGIAGEDA